MDEIETINIQLEHSVAKLVYENKILHKEIKHLKKIYKDQFDSIKKTHAFSKEHCDSLIAQLNSKSMKNADLKCQIQEKVFVTTTLQNELRRIKGKNVLDNASTITNAIIIALGMFKLEIEPISHRLKNNKDAHEDYLKKTIENTDTICGLVERARKQNPRVICSTSASGSKPTGNTKNNRISQSSSSNKTNKVKDQSRSVKSRKNKKNHIAKTECNASDVPSSSSLVDFRLSILFSGTIRFGNDQIEKIMDYGDYQLGNVTISRVYYLEGLGHNLFSVGQFCDSDLEVAFRKHTCHIRDLDGVDLVKGSRGSNLYTLYLENMMSDSPICLLSKA
ncbi:hypothetical protein Tco_1467444, partial [Tanacetum coccineum]